MPIPSCSASNSLFPALTQQSGPGASVTALFFRLLRSLSSYQQDSKESAEAGKESKEVCGIQRVEREYRELEKAVVNRTGRSKVRGLNNGSRKLGESGNKLSISSSSNSKAGPRTSRMSMARGSMMPRGSFLPPDRAIHLRPEEVDDFDLLEIATVAREAVVYPASRGKQLNGRLAEICRGPTRIKEVLVSESSDDDSSNSSCSDVSIGPSASQVEDKQSV